MSVILPPALACVRIPAGTPPGYTRPSHTSTSSDPHRPLAFLLWPRGRIDEQPDFPSSSPTFSRSWRGGVGVGGLKWSLSTITHSSLPWECEKNLKERQKEKKTPNVLAVTNRAIKLHGPAEQLCSCCGKLCRNDITCAGI